MTPEDEDERGLVLAAQSGDRRAFEQLVRRYKASLYRLARRYVGDADEAYDIVQDTFVSSWLGLGRFDARAPFPAWLRTIALNKCRDRGRRLAVRRRLLALFAAEAPGPVPPAGPGEDPERQLQRRLQCLDREIANLPAHYKEPLLLILGGGLTQQQATEQLGTSAKAIELRLRRARKRLAAALGTAGWDAEG